MASRLSPGARWTTGSGLALVVLPFLLVLGIHRLDLIQYGHPYGYWDRLQTAALDEPAHLATAILVFLVMAGQVRLRRQALLFLAAAAGSMLIDLDHIALYAGVPDIAPAGRPFTHSAFTVVVLLVAGLVARGRARQVLLGLSLGVLCHLWRDIATGPGIPLWWPVDQGGYSMRYDWYSRGLVVVAALATIRQLAVLRWPGKPRSAHPTEPRRQETVAISQAGPRTEKT